MRNTDKLLKNAEKRNIELEEFKFHTSFMLMYGRLDFSWCMCHLQFDWRLIPGEHTAVFPLKNLTAWKWTVS